MKYIHAFNMALAWLKTPYYSSLPFHERIREGWGLYQIYLEGELLMDRRTTQGYIEEIIRFVLFLVGVGMIFSLFYVDL